MNRRYCFTLDLKNDPVLIAEYKKYHEKVWPDVAQTYREHGIDSMEIYLTGTRMFMIMEVNESFSFEKKAKLDRSNPRLREWEQLMEKYQDVSPETGNGDKWKQMECIFRLQDS